MKPVEQRIFRTFLESYGVAEADAELLAGEANGSSTDVITLRDAAPALKALGESLMSDRFKTVGWGLLERLGVPISDSPSKVAHATRIHGEVPWNPSRTDAVARANGWLNLLRSTADNIGLSDDEKIALDYVLAQLPAVEIHGRWPSDGTTDGSTDLIKLYDILFRLQARTGQTPTLVKRERPEGGAAPTDFKNADLINHSLTALWDLAVVTKIEWDLVPLTKGEPPLTERRRMLVDSATGWWQLLVPGIRASDIYDIEERMFGRFWAIAASTRRTVKILDVDERHVGEAAVDLGLK